MTFCTSYTSLNIHHSGAISNKELATRVVDLLDEKGFTPDNTLLATSVCADELARELEDTFVDESPSLYYFMIEFVLFR